MKYVLLTLFFMLAMSIGYLAGVQRDCSHPKLADEEWRWLIDNMAHARESHQRAYDSGNAYWMPLQKQLEWVIIYDRVVEIFEQMRG